MRLVDDLPRNAMGKVVKARVKELFESLRYGAAAAIAGAGRPARERGRAALIATAGRDADVSR